jgi:hypothetical protein
MSLRALLRRFPRLAFGLAVAAGVASSVGCTPNIGDKCTLSTDCSQTGDRLCDTTEPGGYCTVFNCQPDTCPNSICVAFDSTLDPSCGGVVGGQWPRFQRSFCMAQCGSNGDCREQYECVDLSNPANATLRRAQVVDQDAPLSWGLGYLVCMPSTCADGIQDALETDVDCGGPICNACNDQQKCLSGTDCMSSTCVNGICVDQTCLFPDGGTQTDYECGGPQCAPCAAGKGCLVGTDCTSGLCVSSSGSLTCAPGDCTDKMKNGDETDVDCGGIRCGPCAIGQVCQGDSDCANLNCESGVCTIPSICYVPDGGAPLPPAYDAGPVDLDAGG